MSLRYRAADVASACGGTIVHGDPNVWITGVAIDSRQVRPGDLFVALPGERTDGHHFVGEALFRRAAAAMVRRWPLEEVGDRGTIIQVADPLIGLGRWASLHRKRFADAAVVAVTGSVGKTSTKEMIASVASRRFRVLKSPGNYNNEIGVPLGMLTWDTGHRLAVFELAMRGSGEIRYLAELLKPDIGVITNIGETHLERLGSLAAIADAKAELVESLSASGYAILNEDDPRVRAMASRTRAKVIRYGLSPNADIRADTVRTVRGFTTEFQLLFPHERVRVRLPVPGRHHVHNSLAAAAVAFVLGLPAQETAEGLETFQPGPHRLQVFAVDGVTVIDDTYNASPASLRAALEMVSEIPRTGRLLVVLGDMLELGSASRSAHRQAGRMVAERADGFFACGEAMAEAVATAVASMGAERARHFRDRASLVAALRNWVREGDVVLIKGSRGAQMEEAVEALLSPHRG